MRDAAKWAAPLHKYDYGSAVAAIGLSKRRAATWGRTLVATLLRWVVTPANCQNLSLVFRLELINLTSTNPLPAVSVAIVILLLANHPGRAHRSDRGVGKARRHALGFVR